jgi:DNA polymerase III alpha subunit
MKQNKFGEMIFGEQDLVDLIMQGGDLTVLDGLTVDNTINIEPIATVLEHVPEFIKYNELVEQMSMEQFDQRNQHNWHMPDLYKQLDIAEHVLSLCHSPEELQRCGQELLLFQERDLFNLLRYLKYLIDTMTEHKIIWGVGRGSSVASYVLYKLGVHKIDSLFYDLDPEEFLR